MKKLCILLCLLLAGCSAAPQVTPSAAHRFVQANYQTPKTCTECGLTEGEPLTPDFVSYEIALNEGDAVWEKTDTGYRATLVFAEQDEDITVIPGIEDYYDIKLRDHTEIAPADEGWYEYQVFFEGKRQTVRYRITTEFSGWQQGEGGMENVCTVTWEWETPAGYDGLVLTLRESGDWPDGQYLYDIDRSDMLLFRP